jgi:hypothetical protein
MRGVAFDDPAPAAHPGEALAGDVGVKRPQVDGKAPERNAAFGQLEGELLGQLSRRRALPGLQHEPLDQGTASERIRLEDRKGRLRRDLVDYAFVERHIAANGECLRQGPLVTPSPVLDGAILHPQVPVMSRSLEGTKAAECRRQEYARGHVRLRKVAVCREVGLTN